MKTKAERDEILFLGKRPTSNSELSTTREGGPWERGTQFFSCVYPCPSVVGKPGWFSFLKNFVHFSSARTYTREMPPQYGQSPRSAVGLSDRPVFSRVPMLY